MLQVEREQAIAFRLQGHHLDKRLPLAQMLDAAGACGLQNTPPGSAELALQTRVEDLTPELFEQVLIKDKSLLQAWSIRISPIIFPAHDLAVFSVSMLPESEDEWRFVMQSYLPTLDKAGMTVAKTYATITKAAAQVLDGQILAKSELSGRMNEVVPKKILFWCEGCKSYHVNETAFRLMGEAGGVCFGPRQGNSAFLARTDQWLEEMPSLKNVKKAQAELVRRYLRCYGPSTSKHLAEWVKISPDHAARLWQLVEGELTEVKFGKGAAWVLTEDVSRLEKAESPDNVRLVPPYDHYLQLRDRATIAPTKAMQTSIWKILGNPGVVLSNGELVALWKTAKKGKVLTVSVDPFVPLDSNTQDGIEAEAVLLAPFKGCTSVKIEVA